MALVLKIKHKETLRRWVVSQTLPEKSSDFSLSVRELESKVRELFQFSAHVVLLITYVDKEGDVVTLADDQDLLDACIVQGLNPLRLEVKTFENGHKSSAESVANIAPYDGGSGADSVYETSPLHNSNDSGSSERTSRQPFPQATADAIKQFLTKYTQNIDPNLQPAVLLKNIHKALKDFVKTLVHEGQRLAPRGVHPSSRSPAYTPCVTQTPVHSSSIDNGDQIVHFGVRCDGCDLHPIRGLRYKSTKVFNYDLCSTCFSKMGNESDYQRIEKPVNSPCHGFFHPSPSNGKTNRVPMKWMTPFATGSDGWKSECPFLRTPSGHPIDIPNNYVTYNYDASFLKDVSVSDSAELGPCAHFTRILRLKNTGSLPWPQGTTFVHVAGDKLGLEMAVVLKLPEGGLPVGLEFNVVIDMRAPEKAGNYISHWRLMGPNGEEFGQSVWVAVQVVGDMNEPHQAQVACKKDDNAEEVSKIESKVECAPVFEVDDSLSLTQSKGLGSYKSDEGTSSLEQAAGSTQFIISGFIDHNNADSGSDDVDGFSMIEKPGDMRSSKMVHAPLVTSQVAFPHPISVIDEQYGRMSPLEVATQEMNLHELEVMGFKNRNLNAILLEKNKQNLQLTLDDLLLGSGWDNLLKDLQEMGFDDANTNLRLLIKNEGSIKRVVKELVELEKSQSGGLFV